MILVKAEVVADLLLISVRLCPLSWHDYDGFGTRSSYQHPETKTGKLGSPRLQFASVSSWIFWRERRDQERTDTHCTQNISQEAGQIPVMV
jgi:hypothetical protein